ncbi:MAG: hypothetical protein K2X27_20425 [Candidatus Obscuribacterales bacterium]|nr:hypothetical protein [Candidatus Obscuribacterales bacterium]
MKLEEMIPVENDLINMSLADLADKVLVCLSAFSKNGTQIRRRGLAGRLLMGYPSEFERQSRLAIEEALMLLENQMLIGVDPDEQEFVFITRLGKSHLGEIEQAPVLARNR